MRNQKKAYTAAGTVMAVLGLVFFLTALRHPERSFPWPNAVTYTAYVLYAAYTVILFCMPKMKRANLRSCILLAVQFLAIVLLVQSICTRNGSGKANWYLPAALFLTAAANFANAFCIRKEKQRKDGEGRAE